jgi:hypothetical protein
MNSREQLARVSSEHVGSSVVGERRMSTNCIHAIYIPSIHFPRRSPYIRHGYFVENEYRDFAIGLFSFDAQRRIYDGSLVQDHCRSSVHAANFLIGRKQSGGGLEDEDDNIGH